MEVTWAFLLSALGAAAIAGGVFAVFRTKGTRETIDLIVLDLMLPGEDGLSICRRLRAANDLTPIIMLTAKVEDLTAKVEAKKTAGPAKTPFLIAKENADNARAKKRNQFLFSVHWLFL